MSSLWIPDQGEEIMLDLITAADASLKLYKTDVDSGLTAAQKEALDETDFTEADFAGYAAKTLTGGSWVTTQASPSVAAYAEQTFTRSSTGTAQNIYGYYVVRSSDGKLLWYEQWDTLVTITNSGEDILVTPQITLDDRGGTEAVAIGEIKVWPVAAAPTNHLLCDGTAVSRATYAELFALIGTDFGVGDGSTTFNLPDLIANGIRADEIGPINWTPTLVNWTGTATTTNSTWLERRNEWVHLHMRHNVETIASTMQITLPFSSYEALGLNAGIATAVEQSPRAKHFGHILGTTTTAIQIRQDSSSTSWNTTVPFSWDTTAKTDIVQFDLWYKTPDTQPPPTSYVIRAL